MHCHQSHTLPDSLLEIVRSITVSALERRGLITRTDDGYARTQDIASESEAVPRTNRLAVTWLIVGDALYVVAIARWS